MDQEKIILAQTMMCITKENLIIAYMLSMVLVAFLFLVAVTAFFIHVIRQDLKDQPKKDGQNFIDRIRNQHKRP